MAKLEKECGSRCRSRSHAGELVAAVTKGNLRQLQIYLSTCSNPTGITDVYHRSVLHMAASCGKWQLMEWLLDELGMETTGKDRESGWTALHRALFYGQLTAARLLIQHGGSLQTRDREGLFPLDLVMKDRLPHVEFVQSGLQEVYTWGDNSNFTLGHENEQRRRQPEMIDSFRKKGVSIKQVLMSKYHTVFVSTAGQVFTCGHGRGGRLGHGNEQTCLEPRIVEVVRHEVCVSAAVGRDHTLMLMESGSVYSCGLNDCHQLGQIPPPPCSLAPKQMNSKLLKGRRLRGVACNRFHSVLYTRDSLFTFGLNAGQLGHLKVGGEKVITVPRQVSSLNHAGLEILQVTCSDAATAVCTSRGDVYVLHEYLCRKVVSRWLGLTELRVVGGHLDHKMEESLLRERGGSQLTIAMLNNTGKVLLWRAQDPVARRCAWSTKRSLHITNLTLTLHNLVFITQDGDGFTATLPKIKVKEKGDKVTDLAHPSGPEKFPLSLSDIVSRDEFLEVTVEKIPIVHRATAATTDRKGRNYAVLQCQPNACLTDIPQVSGSEMTSHMARLLSESDVTDVIHDCVLRVNEHTIPTHKFILSCRSDYFRKILIDSSINEQDTPSIDVDNVNYDVFRQMLLYMYSDTCDILTLGKKLQFSIPVNNNININSNTNSSLHKPGMDSSDNVINMHKKDGQDKISAFAVREKQKKKNKKGSKKDAELNGVTGTDETVPMATQSKNPVTRLLDFGRRFGVKSLTKRLEAVKCQGGVIHAVSGRHLPSPSVRFSRQKYPSLYDVTLQCADGTLLKAHRCVLVARLEYFHSMLASGWIETSMDQPLTLPVPGDVMSVVLDFLYTDSCPEVDACEDIEFLCNVLVVADQLLIPRLREMCETRIASEISLKNAAELLEVSSFYNAEQLKLTCQQFVCVNLAALLENHSLDVLSAEVMEELTQYYRQMIPGMCRRHITPFSEGPSIQFLEELEIRCSGSEVKAEGQGEGRKVKARRKRTRTKSSGDEFTSSSLRGDRKVSVCSVNSELDTTLEEVTEEASPGQPSPRQQGDGQNEDVRHCLSSVQASSLVSRLPKFTTDWPKLPPKHAQSATKPLLKKSSQQLNGCQDNQAAKETTCESGSGDASLSNFGLREIIAQQEALERSGSSAQRSGGPKQPSSGKKLSQKERKRLARRTKEPENSGTSTEGTETSLLVSPDTAEQGAKPKSWTTTKVWGGDISPSLPVQSFKDLMVSEEKRVVSRPLHVQTHAQTHPQTHPPAHTPTPTTSQRKQGQTKTDLSLSWGLTVQPKSAKPDIAPTSPSSPESPRDNPWQPVTSPVSPGNTSLRFTDIVKDEAKQRETLKKATNKPLSLIQIEEEAKSALIELYTSTCKVKDARLSIERVQTQMARPTWPAQHSKHT